MCARERFYLAEWTVLIAFSVLGPACSKPDSLSSPERVSPPSPVATSPASSVPSGPALAVLEELVPRVTYRRKSELVWQEGAANLPLYQFDAVKTHTQASAKVVFSNRSVLDLSESTLVIINQAPADSGKSSPGRSVDRAVVRGGKLKGETKTELWLLTSSALFQMKARKDGQAARASLSVQEGKKLRVELEEGSGSLLHRTEGGTARKIELSPRRPVVLDAPAAGETFGQNLEIEAWANEARAAELASAAPPKKRAVAAAAPAAPTPPVPAAMEKVDVFINSPANQSETSGSSAAFRGRATSSKGQILINGNPVRLGAKLDFELSVPLQPGANSVLIQVIQPDRTSSVRRWTLIRKE